MPRMSGFHRRRVAAMHEIQRLIRARQAAEAGLPRFVRPGAASVATAATGTRKTSRRGRWSASDSAQSYKVLKRDFVTRGSGCGGVHLTLLALI